MNGYTSHRKAFTLIELLVVISIIAILMGLLLPALSFARRASYSAKCRSNMRSVAITAEGYTQSHRGLLPPSYVYPDRDGKVNMKFPMPRPYFGYQHWSYYLFRSGAGPEAFTCPEFPNGGLPSTNPGPDARDWEDGQVDRGGNGPPGPGEKRLKDLQAARMAFTANAALMPHNKFTTQISGGPRVNVLVPPEIVEVPSKTILATEFNSYWRTIARPNGRSWSHRPVSPFSIIGGGVGGDRFNGPINRSIYMYPEGRFGIAPADSIADANSLIETTQNDLNLIGRHHLGSYTVDGISYGESSNFVYLDGHVETKNVVQTVEQREWGMRYYSITGDNEIVNYYK